MAREGSPVSRREHRRVFFPFSSASCPVGLARSSGAVLAAAGNCSGILKEYHSQTVFIFRGAHCELVAPPSVPSSFHYYSRNSDSPFSFRRGARALRTFLGLFQVEIG